VILVLTATFVCIFAIVLGAFWLFIVREEAGAHRALQKRLRPQEETARKGALTVAKTEEKRATLFHGVQNVIDQSGKPLTVLGLLFMCLCSGVVSGATAWVATGRPVIAAILGAVALITPYLVVKRAATKRMWRFEEQFPEAVDLIARALRAGHAFPTALSMIAEELGEPVGPEFKLLYDRQNFGMPLPDALRSFAARVPILDARFFVTAVLTQREAGGNLSGVLDNLSSVIRERFKVKRQIRVISAHGRMTAYILAAMPPTVGAAQFVISPDTANLLFDDPLGIKMVIGALVLQGIGMLWIQKIVRIEY